MVYHSAVQRTALLEVLNDIARGRLTPEEAAERLAQLPFIGSAEVLADSHRWLRTGQGEAVLCSGKTPAQAAEAFSILARAGRPVLATRASQEHEAAILASVPEAEAHPTARIVVLPGAEPIGAAVAVVCAGTSDLPVAEEAAVTVEALGARAVRLRDVGVAGLHRLLAHLDDLRVADVVIVVAGMEGALPSVVAGLVAAPVVAVPTSVGYGAAFGGLAPLLAMLNACAPGVAVVNIDNGFGAAMVAMRMLRARRSPA